MENVDKIIDKFISEVKEKTHNKVIAVLVYGSRVLNTAREDSDLDILVICDGNRNYRLGSIIDGIKIDCTMYGIDNIYDVMDEKRKLNNNYFYSILEYGRVVVDETGVIDVMKSYLEEIEDMKLPKRKVSPKILSELRELYTSYNSEKDDYSYFNLLEKIRTIYHYKNHLSFLSLVKVLKVYEHTEKYKSSYHLNLPKDSFIKLFLEAIQCNDDNLRIEYTKKLMGYINVSCESYSYYDDGTYISIDEIKYKLLIFYNRLSELQKIVMESDSSFDYIYYVTLNQLIELARILNCQGIAYNEEIEYSRECKNKYEMMNHLWNLFMKVGNDYHFDYKKYMIKL